MSKRLHWMGDLAGKMRDPLQEQSDERLRRVDDGCISSVERTRAHTGRLARADGRQRADKAVILDVDDHDVVEKQVGRKSSSSVGAVVS